MFVELSPAELARVSSQLAEIDLPVGTTIMSQHQHGREAVIIVDGLAEVSVDGRTVATVSSGSLVGEQALLDNRPRTATVTALTRVRAFVLNPREFSVLFEHEQSARWIATELARRLRDASVAPAALPA
jgi:CRP-like cAMP-binding protein